MPLRVALINRVPASHSALAALLTFGWMQELAASLQVQLQRDVAPFWPYAQDATVRFACSPRDVQPGEVPATIQPTMDDAPGDIAYHDDAGGLPDEFLASDTCQSLDDLSKALSHENCEVCGDPMCDQWVTLPSGIALPAGVVAGQQVARENCDPIQERSYRIGEIAVSDFLTPAYFDPTISGPTSYGETIGLPRVAPLSCLPGGYWLLRNADGSGESQLFGEFALHKFAKARHPASRLYRHGVRL